MAAPSDRTVAAAPRLSPFWSDFLLTLPFAAFFLVQLAHHEMWRDELNAFGLAVASPNLSTLFLRMHYEVHPWLWYVLLWLVGKITPFPIGMRVLGGVIGLGSYFTIGLRSPFNRLEKVLLFLCYFVCFEYSVILRMYGVLLFLLVIYLWQCTKDEQDHPVQYVLLGLMAGTDLTGIMLSVALLVQRVIHAGLFRRDRQAAARRKIALPSFAIYAILLMFSLWSMWPAKDVSTRTTPLPFQSLFSPREFWHAALDAIVLPYFATFTYSARYYWNAIAPHHLHKFPLAVPFILFAYWITFRKRLDLRILMALSIAMIILFIDFVYRGASMRHFGVTFLAFFAGIWILRASGESLSGWAYTLLLLTAFTGVEASFKQWQRPFSNAENAAIWIQHHPEGALPLAGSPDTSVIGVAEILHRPIYLLDCRCERTFLLFSKERDDFNKREIPERLQEAVGVREKSPVLYVGDVAFKPDQIAALERLHLHVEPLAAFEGAPVFEEDFFLFKITPQQP